MKKKLLALLLAVMMIAVLVPAIAVSALASGAGDLVPDDRAEVAVHEPLLEEDNVEVLNKDGVRVGYFATLTEAVADLRAGDTVQLLDDVADAEPVVLSGNFVLNGNSFALSGSINVIGNGTTDIEIHNLTVTASGNAVAITVSALNGTDAVDLTLTNCDVTTTGVIAVKVIGKNTSLTVKGAGGSYHSTWYAISNHGGFVDIYAGEFSADLGAISSATSNGVPSTTAIYGGTFLSGKGALEAIYAYGGSTVILADGEFATTAGSDTPLITNDDSDVRVLGGKYYLADSNAPLFVGDGSYEVYGGYFYGQSEVDLGIAEIDDAYATNAYTYEDPTFPANTKLDAVKELGYLSMKEVTYHNEWLAENGYDVTGTAYDVTNGVYNENPVSYYAFELERAYWYLGNGGSLTVTRDAEFTSDSALTFRARPQTSVVTLQSSAVGGTPFALNTYMEGNYPLVATGGTYNITNVALTNELGSAILLDQDNTDAIGSVLNLQSGAEVAGYKNHAIWVGAYATLNVYDGAYVHAAAGTAGNYDGSGFGLVAMIGGNLNMYGGNLGYARLYDENGHPVDTMTTGKMNTVAVGVDTGSTCVSNINISGGKLGLTGVSGSPYAILNLTDASERIDGTKVTITGGTFNSPVNNVIRSGERSIDYLITGGSFNAPGSHTGKANYADLFVMDGLNADVKNRVTIEGGSFNGGHDMFAVWGHAELHVVDADLTGAYSAFFAGASDAGGTAKITIDDLTLNGTAQAFWCGQTEIHVKNGTFNNKTTIFNLANDSATAGNITIDGGVYNVGGGYFINVAGAAKRTVTVANVEFNSSGSGGSGICFGGSGNADVIVNSGTFKNMISSNHIIETWGNASTTGTLTINDATILRSGAASGRMIKFYGCQDVTINGGYFQSDCSETFVIEKNGDLVPIMTFTINGGTFYNDKSGYSLICMPSNAAAELVINDGTFRNYSPAWGPCLDVGGSGSTNIYGGSFESLAPLGQTGSDACITVSDGICNIYAGTFRANGMCVARGLAGSTDSETNVNGSIKTKANSRLNIYGGVLILEENIARSTCSWDGVIRCGGGSTYAFVSIHGGTFICTRQGPSQVINKNNVHSSINITGGVFMATGYQDYYYKSGGMADTGGSENPTEPLVRSNDDPQVNYGDKQYYQLVYGTGASPFNGKMEEGAQIRLVNDGESYSGGIRFVSRYTAGAVASLKSFAGGDINNVVFGTLIVKTEQLDSLSSLSHAALKKAGLEDYMDIVATDGVLGSESAGFTVVAALANITAADYSTSYSAVGYAMVELDSGNQVYFYTDFDQEKNSRSIAQVAEAALADVRDSQTQGYVYAHITLEGKYSRYTPEQQNALLAYIPTSAE